MTILVDRELRNHLGSIPSTLIQGYDATKMARGIHGCSVDLHIGKIYRPGVDTGKAGSASNPAQLPVTLKEGETAVLETAELFRLDMSHAAFVSPTSGVSIQGLLMTNPGHVDPGYQGSLHVTVINMGRADFSLQPGARFLRAAIHKLDSPATITPPNPKPITQELIDKLAADFLSVGARTAVAAKKEIESAVLRTQLMQFFFPLIATIGAAVLGAWLSNWSTTARFEERIKVLETANALDRIKTLEQSYPLEKRLLNIEDQLKNARSPAEKPSPLRSLKDVK